MKSPSVYSAERSAGRGHIPLFPMGYFVHRLLQLALIIALLGVTAASVTVPWFLWEVIPSLVFASVALIVTTWHLVAYYGMSKAYNYWAVLAFDIIFLAIISSELNSIAAIGNRYHGIGHKHPLWIALALISILLFASYITTLILHAIGIYRHCYRNGHSKPESSGVSPLMANDHVDVENQNAQVTTNPAYQPINQGQNDLPQQQGQTAEQQHQMAEQEQQAAMPDAH